MIHSFLILKIRDRILPAESTSLLIETISFVQSHSEETSEYSHDNEQHSINFHCNGCEDRNFRLISQSQRTDPFWKMAIVILWDVCTWLLLHLSLHIIPGLYEHYASPQLESAECLMRHFRYPASKWENKGVTNGKQVTSRDILKCSTASLVTFRTATCTYFRSSAWGSTRDSTESKQEQQIHRWSWTMASCHFKTSEWRQHHIKVKNSMTRGYSYTV